jgi:chemotaxis methyl-accepting protein methylase
MPIFGENRDMTAGNPPPRRFGADATKPGTVGKDTVRISCRVTNPLSVQDDLSKVFLDSNQAKATTATRLFRNEDLFEGLRKLVMPDVMSRRKSMTVWSTGCSSGEEVYSLAMVALAEFAKAKRPMSAFRIFGTDISQDRINEGRSGHYGRPSANAFEPAYWTLLKRYAQVEGPSVVMGDELRSVAKFGLFDMRQKPKKHTFDFIVCNHVLQYYDNPGQLHILQNLMAVLNPGGYLYLEGITDAAVSGARIRKVQGNFYLPPDQRDAGPK